MPINKEKLAKKFGFVHNLEANTFYNKVLKAYLTFFNAYPGIYVEITKEFGDKSVTIDMPFNLKHGKCRKINYRHNEDYLKQDIKAMISAFGTYTEDGFHQMEIWQMGKNKDYGYVRSEYCPKAYIDKNKISESIMSDIQMYGHYRKKLLCKVQTNENGLAIVTATR
ncbi:hypothetical protein QM004_10510 [Bacillus subtilis]|uniref:hypothetical protein n=1 Tax=Bacillus subtilis TaxID=1423 RepID=UPI00255D14C5|nr:hypothetical protein [Bacillus subtilis]WIY67534.1 hypothetical protein QM004_10510 [Bacillus subtilis]